MMFVEASPLDPARPRVQGRVYRVLYTYLDPQTLLWWAEAYAERSRRGWSFRVQGNELWAIEPENSHT